MTNMPTELGKRLRNLREAAGFSIDSLAVESGVHRDHIGRIERGESANPRKNTIIALAKALHTDPVFLEWGSNGYNAPKQRSVTIKEEISPYGRLPKEDQSLIEAFHSAPEDIKKAIKTFLHMDEKPQKKTGTKR